MRARVDNPLRDGGRYTTVFSLDDAESRTADVDPKLVDDKDFRFVLQRYVPGLQSITWARGDETAVLELRAQDASWAEVVVAEAPPGRYVITQAVPTGSGTTWNGRHRCGTRSGGQPGNGSV